MISVRIYADEVTVATSKIPKQIQIALREKLATVMDTLRRGAFQGIPGKFLDKRQLEFGVEPVGDNLTVGYMEYADKSGVYSILPVKAHILYNKTQNFIAHEVHQHPFPKGADWIERYLEMQKPWIEAELSDLPDLDL